MTPRGPGSGALPRSHPCVDRETAGSTRSPDFFEEFSAGGVFAGETCCRYSSPAATAATASSPADTQYAAENVVHGALVFRRADERRAAADPGRRPFFTTLVTSADAPELPRLAALSEQWEEIAGGYDVAVQLAAVVDGLLPRRADLP